MNTTNARAVLPLASDQKTRVPPRTPTRIFAKPEHGPLLLERLYISGTGTAGGASDWVVNDIEIDGVSQLSVKDLPGALFSARGIAAGGRHAGSAIHFTGLAVIERKSEVAVTITYVGAHPEGAVFFGSITGGSPPQRDTVLPITTRKLMPLIKTTISASLDAPLKIAMIEIESGSDGSDWIVNDIRVDGTSQFSQEGDIPGDMFSISAIDSFVEFRSGKLIEIDVTYVGLEADGIGFVSRMHGTVVRDDYSQPPLDVHAIVRTTNDFVGDEVVARCNWRA